MADIKVATYEQIATLLAQLQTNYSNIANSYYDIFYNTVPMDVNLQLYDDQGNLQKYLIPNRAKDFRYMRNGQGSPEGAVSAPIGTVYQDTLNGDLYIKQIGDSFVGWTLVNKEDDSVLKGQGAPDGNVTAPKGKLYVDTEDGALYIKHSGYSNTGWALISTVILDAAPTQNSINGITSGAVYTAIQELKDMIEALKAKIG